MGDLYIVIAPLPTPLCAIQYYQISLHCGIKHKFTIRVIFHFPN